MKNAFLFRYGIHQKNYRCKPHQKEKEKHLCQTFGQSFRLFIEWKIVHEHLIAYFVIHIKFICYLDIQSSLIEVEQMWLWHIEKREKKSHTNKLRYGNFSLALNRWSEKPFHATHGSKYFMHEHWPFLFFSLSVSLSICFLLFWWSRKKKSQ